MDSVAMRLQNGVTALGTVRTTLMKVTASKVSATTKAKVSASFCYIIIPYLFDKQANND